VSGSLSFGKQFTGETGTAEWNFIFKRTAPFVLFLAPTTKSLQECEKRPGEKLAQANLQF